LPGIIDLDGKRQILIYFISTNCSDNKSSRRDRRWQSS